MRAVVTRVTSASVEIDGAVHGKIGKGFLVLLGVHQDDTEAEALKIAVAGGFVGAQDVLQRRRSEEHTSELQSH